MSNIVLSHSRHLCSELSFYTSFLACSTVFCMIFYCCIVRTVNCVPNGAIKNFVPAQETFFLDRNRQIVDHPRTSS